MIVYGLELELVRSFKKDLSGHLGYTFQDWDAESHPMDTENTHYFLQALPEHSAVLGLNYKLWKGGLVSLNAKYYGRRFSKKEDLMKDVLVVNVGVEHTFQLPCNCTFTVKGYVRNITDQEYQLRYGYDMPGVTAGISGTLNF